jgi:hypothetical protein
MGQHRNDFHALKLLMQLAKIFIENKCGTKSYFMKSKEGILMNVSVNLSCKTSRQTHKILNRSVYLM